MIREACGEEHMNKQIENERACELYDATRAIAYAYAVAREYAWSGLSKKFSIAIHASASGISTRAKSMPNRIKSSNEEMGSPHLTCLGISNFRAGAFLSEQGVVNPSLNVSVYY